MMFSFLILVITWSARTHAFLFPNINRQSVIHLPDAIEFRTPSPVSFENASVSSSSTYRFAQWLSAVSIPWRVGNTLPLSTQSQIVSITAGYEHEFIVTVLDPHNGYHSVRIHSDHSVMSASPVRWTSSPRLIMCFNHTWIGIDVFGNVKSLFTSGSGEAFRFPFQLDDGDFITAATYDTFARIGVWITFQNRVYMFSETGRHRIFSLPGAQECRYAECIKLFSGGGDRPLLMMVRFFTGGLHTYELNCMFDVLDHKIIPAMIHKKLCECIPIDHHWEIVDYDTFCFVHVHTPSSRIQQYRIHYVKLSTLQRWKTVDSPFYPLYIARNKFNHLRIVPVSLVERISLFQPQSSLAYRYVLSLFQSGILQRASRSRLRRRK